jgi:hypothetical protein
MQNVQRNKLGILDTTETGQSCNVITIMDRPETCSDITSSAKCSSISLRADSVQWQTIRSIEGI